MSLRQIILDKLKTDHRGIEHPIRKEDLMSYLYEVGAISDVDEQSERTVRKVISANDEICNAGCGYYVAREVGHKEDVEQAIEYLTETYERPVIIKINKKKLAFPQYYPRFDPGQMDLF